MAIIACDIMNKYTHTYCSYVHLLQGGSTPLHYAAFHGHQEIVKLLADRGATIDVTDNVS